MPNIETDFQNHFTETIDVRWGKLNRFLNRSVTKFYVNATDDVNDDVNATTAEPRQIKTRTISF